LALGSLVFNEEIAGPFAVSLEWKPMQIKKLTNSSVLKRGESLIVLKCRNGIMTTSLSTYEKALELDSFDSIAIARNRFPGSAAGKMGDASDTQERPMSGGPVARPIQPGRFSKITASPSRSGQSGVGIDYRPPTTISFFGMSEAGRSIG
jgi:hypothetical protein